MGSETNLTSRTIGQKTIVDIDTQNVDFRNCETIKSTVAGLAAQGSKHILLNLSQVSFMDSAGLGTILFCKRACEEAGGSFGIFGLQTYVNNLVTLTNLHKAVPIFTEESDALC